MPLMSAGAPLPPLGMANSPEPAGEHVVPRTCYGGDTVVLRRGSEGHPERIWRVSPVLRGECGGPTGSPASPSLGLTAWPSPLQLSPQVSRQDRAGYFLLQLEPVANRVRALEPER